MQSKTKDEGNEIKGSARKVDQARGDKWNVLITISRRRPLHDEDNARHSQKQPLLRLPLPLPIHIHNSYTCGDKEQRARLVIVLVDLTTRRRKPDASVWSNCVYACTAEVSKIRLSCASARRWQVSQPRREREKERERGAG